jgi:hypothetical protein
MATARCAIGTVGLTQSSPLSGPDKLDDEYVHDKHSRPLDQTPTGSLRNDDAGQFFTGASADQNATQVEA